MTKHELIPIFAAALLLVSATGGAAHDPASVPKGQAAAGVETADLPIRQFPILESPHVKNGPVPQEAYNSNPPTSGPHRAVPLDWGVHDAPVPDWIAVHNLEHGGIWISYRPGLDDAALEKLKQLANHYPNAVVLSPRPKDDRPVIVASWGRIMRLDEADTDKIERFILSFVNDSPEEYASLAHERPKPPSQPVIGAAFPEFSLRDVDGQMVSNVSTSGKPTLFWFTTTWCVPCQIGARRVAGLDDKMGGTAFDVVVVFVDPRETPADLKAWRAKYGNKDWIIAFDNSQAPLSRLTAVQYLDTKFLVAADGTVVDIDVRIADAGYLAKITRLAGQQ